MRNTAGALLMRLALLSPLSVGWLPLPSQAAPVSFGTGTTTEFNGAALDEPKCAFNSTNGQLSYNGLQTVVGSQGFQPAAANGTPAPVDASVTVDLTGLDVAKVVVDAPVLANGATPVNSASLTSAIYFDTIPVGTSGEYEIAAGQPNTKAIGVKFEKTDATRFTNGTYTANVTLTCADVGGQP